MSGVVVLPGPLLDDGLASLLAEQLADPLLDVDALTVTVGKTGRDFGSVAWSLLQAVTA